MKTYELFYIISPEITSEEAGVEAKEIESMVQSKEGFVLKQTNPSAKTLAYPIKKKKSGFFGVLEFQLEPEKINELQGEISKNERVVRYTIINKKPISEIKNKRKTMTEPTDLQSKIEIENIIDKKPSIKTEEKQKVELKDIEQKLEEILGK